jgi:hypothetical protein
VGVLVEMNSETDFVARNEDFKALTRQIVDKVAAYGPGEVPKNTEELLADASDGRTLADVITDAAGRIGEKIQLGRFERFGAPDGNVVGAYVHNPGRQRRGRRQDRRAGRGHRRGPGRAGDPDARTRAPHRLREPDVPERGRCRAGHPGQGARDRPRSGHERP